MSLSGAGPVLLGQPGLHAAHAQRTVPVQPREAGDGATHACAMGPPPALPCQFVHRNNKPATPAASHTEVQTHSCAGLAAARQAGISSTRLTPQHRAVQQRMGGPSVQLGQPASRTAGLSSTQQAAKAQGRQAPHVE